MGPKGSTGATGPTGPSLGITPAYGGLYNRTVTSEIIPPNSTVQLAMPENMPNQNVVIGANTITIVIEGDYFVMIKIATLTSGGGPFDVTYGLRVNGVIVPQMTYTQTLNVIALSNTSNFILRLNAGDVVDLEAFSAEGGTLVFAPLVVPTLVIYRLGD